MSDFDRYFFISASRVEHPKLRFWRGLVVPGKLATIEVTRKRDGLVLRDTRIWFHLHSAEGTEERCESEPWDDDLNRGLVDVGFRSISADNEMLRFSLALRPLLERPERRFGDGFFNSVLVHHIRQSPFAHQDAVSKTLAEVHAVNPVLGDPFTECSEMIDAALSRCAQDLTVRLKYPQSEAEVVLGGAVAQYLDDRFNITNRRLLGL